MGYKMKQGRRSNFRKLLLQETLGSDTVDSPDSRMMISWMIVMLGSHTVTRSTQTQILSKTSRNNQRDYENYLDILFRHAYVRQSFTIIPHLLLCIYIHTYKSLFIICSTLFIHVIQLNPTTRTTQQDKCGKS